MLKYAIAYKKSGKIKFTKYSFDEWRDAQDKLNTYKSKKYFIIQVIA